MARYEYNISIEIHAETEDQAKQLAYITKERIAKLDFVEDYEVNYLELLRNEEILGLERQIAIWKSK